MKGRPSKYPHHDQPHYVYRCYDLAGRLLYVGCSSQPNKRIETHRLHAWWGREVHSTRLIVFPDRWKAMRMESAAIRDERPKCNVKGRWYLRDDRADWTAQDYIEFREAIIQAVESTHGNYGVHTRQLLEDVTAELLARFNVSLFGKQVTA